MIDSYDDLSLHGDAAPTPASKQALPPTLPDDRVQLLFRRWLILLTFSMLIVLNVFNLCEYFDIEDAFLQFYQKNFPPLQQQVFHFANT